MDKKMSINQQSDIQANGKSKNRKHDILFFSAIASFFIIGIMTLFVSRYFAIAGLIASAGSACAFFVIRKKTVDEITAIDVVERNEPAPTAAEEIQRESKVDSHDLVKEISKLKKMTAQTNTELVSYFESEKLNLERISKEYDFFAKKNETITGQIQKCSRSFALENNVVKDLIKKISDNVDEEISFSRGTLDRLGKLFSFINEIIRASDVLRSNSEFLQSLMQSLENISEQIHILSINASIIASRSGDAGKAFMVVAKDERNLADNVKKSVYEMKQNSLRLSDSINEVTSNIKQIDEETKSTHESINNLLMRFEGLNLSISIIERKIDANTAILKDMESLIDANIETHKNTQSQPEQARAQNIDKLQANIKNLFEEIASL
jgi:methyl-accepting chemotaxis protein